VHLVGFSIRICHDARSTERQRLKITVITKFRYPELFPFGKDYKPSRFQKKKGHLVANLVIIRVAYSHF